MKRLLAVLLAASALSAAESPRWTDPKGLFSCDVPEGWVFQEFKDGTAIFHERDKKPPAFLNLRHPTDLPKEAAKSLDAYAKHCLKELSVEAKDAKPCKVGPFNAIRASGPVGPSGGKLLDLLVFIEGGKSGYYTVMLTCLPDDRKTYEPVLDAFLKGLSLPYGSDHKGK